MNEDIKIIKKKYGEEMMHYCRTNFSTILEIPGKLTEILLNNFEPTHSLYKDIKEQEKEDEFKDYIYEIFDDVRKEKIKTNKTPQELLDQAGYDLYECKTEEDIQSFKKYYKSGEELCTFNGNRLDRCYVFFAVKKNIDEIKRENFKNPKRQDEYGTSVISIQFTKDNSHTLSIKNRYNHTVKNPDATFSNNLDNIIEGLTEAFEQVYGLEQKYKQSIELEGYVRANDGKYYKYNYEINNIYYCPNNIIIDNFEVKRYPKESSIVLDWFILRQVYDKEKKENVIKVDVYDKKLTNAFGESFGSIKRVTITKSENKKNRIVTVTPEVGEDIIVELNENNEIIGYKNNSVLEIGENFLYYNEKLKKIEINNAEIIGMNAFFNGRDIYEVIAPKVKIIKKCAFFYNKELTELNLPNVEEIKEKAFNYNQEISKIIAPKLKIIKEYVFENNIELTELNLPNIEEIGEKAFFCNHKIAIIIASKLEKIMKYAFWSIEKIKKLDIPDNIFIDESNIAIYKFLEKRKVPKLQLAKKYIKRILIK